MGHLWKCGFCAAGRKKHFLAPATFLFSRFTKLAFIIFGQFGWHEINMRRMHYKFYDELENGTK